MTILISPKKIPEDNRYLGRMIPLIKNRKHVVLSIYPISLLLPWYRIVHGARAIILTTNGAKFWMTLPARVLGLRVFWIEERLVDRQLRQYGTRLWYRALARFVDIITSARIMKRQLIDAGLQDKRIHPIVPGINVEELGVQRTLFSSHAEQKSARGVGFSIGTIAGLEPDKGIEFLLQAFKIASDHIPALHLTIVGHGPSKQQLQWLAKKLQISESVLFVGWQEQPVRWIQGFDLIVMPHVRKERFSDILLTAMASERPIITTDVGTFPEMIERRKTGVIIEPRNATMMAEAIINLYHHPEWRAEMGKRAHERVLEHYSVERMMNALNSFFD